MGLSVTPLVSGSSAAPAASGTASTPAVTTAAPAAATASSNAAISASTGPNLAAEQAASALAATKAAGLKANVVFPPRPSATPAEVAQAAESGTVTPLYTGTPAPEGLAYYGLSSDDEGNPVGTILNTTGVEGIVDTNATGIQALDLFDSSPDAWGVQLNSVTTNVTLFGQPGYQFWTQNVVEYYPTSDFLILVTNVWNFSGEPISANAIYAHGPYGTDYAGELGYYYAEAEIPWLVLQPFNLTLNMNSSVVDGRDAVTFTVTLTSSVYPDENFSAPYDYVIFNSTTATSPPVTVPSNYTANGLQYDPVGLTNDFELDLCGPGGGSQADFLTADATLGLAYWDGSEFVSVPAAFNYGGETGETASGVTIGWNSGAGGPGGLSDYGVASTGPSFLNGLWGTPIPSGVNPVTFTVSPANAFIVLAQNGPLDVHPAFEVGEAALASTEATNTYYLTPGNYLYEVELSDYAAVSGSVTVTSPTSVSVTLASHPAAGVYTPLWAFSNAEVAGLAIAGGGTPSSPYILPNAQSAPLNAIFGQYNDYGFPVYPGVFLTNTTVSTELYKPASFSTYTNTFAFPGPYLPATNDLQYWFVNVSGVSLVDATNISGWFDSSTYYPAVFDTFNVIFYASTGNLIAGNHFDTESGGLLLFSGGTIFGALNVGGGNNTVWGNTFLEVPAPVCPTYPTCLATTPFELGLGLELAEGIALDPESLAPIPGSYTGADTIYNNAFYTPTTAWLLPLNLYSGYAEFFGDNWNISEQPAAVAHTAPGFPTISLFGSIVGSSYQGGNYWWDYGVTYNPYNGADNPLGVLPYDENAPTLLVEVYGPSYYYATYIYPGGDYVPLLAPVGAPNSATFHATGIISGAAWGVTVYGSDGYVIGGFNTTAGAFTVPLPGPGKYEWGADPAFGYLSTAGGTVHLVSHPLTIAVPYHLAPGYAILTFRETGLPPGTTWSFAITSPAFAAATYSTNSPKYQIVAVKGDAYDYAFYGVPGYTPSPLNGGLLVNGPTTVVGHYTRTTYALTFTETGLPTGDKWTVTISGPIHGSGSQTAHGSSTGTSLVFTVPNGTYSYSVQAPHGYACVPGSGSDVVNGAPVTTSLTCHPSGGGGAPVAQGGPSAVPSIDSARSLTVRAEAA